MTDQSSQPTQHNQMPKEARMTDDPTYDATLDPCSPDFDPATFMEGATHEPLLDDRPECTWARLQQALASEPEAGEPGYRSTLPGWLSTKRVRALLSINNCGTPVGFRSEVEHVHRQHMSYDRIVAWELLGTTGSIYVDARTTDVVRVRNIHPLP